MSLSDENVLFSLFEGTVRGTSVTVLQLPIENPISCAGVVAVSLPPAHHQCMAAGLLLAPAMPTPLQRSDKGMLKTNFVVKHPAQMAGASCSILAYSRCFNRCIFQWVHKTFLWRKLASLFCGCRNAVHNVSAMNMCL